LVESERQGAVKVVAALVNIVVSVKHVVVAVVINSI